MSPRRVGPLTLLLAVLLVNLPVTHAWWTDRRLDREGIGTTATVERVRSLPAAGEGRRHFVVYRLPESVDPERRAHTGEVDARTFARARATGRLEVTYLPGDPAENRPVGHVSAGRLALWLTLLADLAIAAMVGLMVWARRRPSELVLVATRDVVRCRPGSALEEVAPGEYVVRGDVVDRSEAELTIAVGDRVVRVLLGDHANPVGHQQPAEARGRLEPGATGP